MYASRYLWHFVSIIDYIFMSYNVHVPFQFIAEQQLLLFKYTLLNPEATNMSTMVNLKDQGR